MSASQRCVLNITHWAESTKTNWRDPGVFRRRTSLWSHYNTHSER